MDNLTIPVQENAANWNAKVTSVLDAAIERIFSNETIRYVTISYKIVDQYFMVYKNYITLVVRPNTIISDPFGESFSFNDLKLGMLVDADFSSAMTFSVPPQARAFRIIASYKNWPFNSKTDRVLEVDVKNRFLYTGNANDINSQVRFVITNSTQILDRAGNRIRLQALRPGQLVRIASATFMTMSIPPQTTAFSVQLL
jgi:hypothetical protein